MSIELMPENQQNKSLVRTQKSCAAQFSRYKAK